MKIRTTLAIAALAIASLAFTFKGQANSECDGTCPEGTSTPATKIGSVSVEELARNRTLVAVLDVNGDETRKKMGYIKGARLLSHYTNFKAKELPAAKGRALVFYCYNESCGASHRAAEKAIELGYTKVATLPAGIKGWKAAGKPTDTVR